MTKLHDSGQAHRDHSGGFIGSIQLNRSGGNVQPAGESILKTLDMVVSISEHTINHQFHLLRRRGIIYSNWNIVFFDPEPPRPPRPARVNQSAQDFAKDLVDEDFGSGFDAEVGDPRISISENKPKTLLFFIPFKSGKMYYWSHGKKKQEDMAGWVYAFEVEIGSIKKDVKEDPSLRWMVSDDSRAAARAVISGSGLDQKYFTIESLFLDFDNAKYAAYDETASNVPREQQSLAVFQNLLSNYFKGLATTDNPYILGYACTVEDIPNQQDAMFQPTALKYSTTYDANEHLRAFNYLLMTGGKSFSTNQDVGVFPTSLLTDPDPEISGELTLSAELFCNTMLDAIGFEDIYAKAFANTRTQATGLSKAGWGYNVTVDPLQSQDGILTRREYGEAAIPHPYIYSIAGTGQVTTAHWFQEVSSIVPVIKFFDGALFIKDQSVSVELLLRDLDSGGSSKPYETKLQDYTFSIAEFRDKTGDKTKCSLGLGVADYTNTQQKELSNPPPRLSRGYRNTTIPAYRIYRIEAGAAGTLTVTMVADSEGELKTESIAGFSKSVDSVFAEFHSRMKDSVKVSMEKISDALKTLSGGRIILPCAKVYSYKDLRFEHPTEKKDISENTVKVKVTYQREEG